MYTPTMATPTLSSHRLAGSLGEILIDVRSGGRDSARPAIVVVHGWKGFKDWGMFPPLAERLARAGFATVTFNLSGSGVDDRGEAVWPERSGTRFMAIAANEAGPVVLAEGRFSDSPFIAFRWLKAPGETYGLGPVAKALPDIRTAN